MTTMMRGVRGATTAEQNTTDEIMSATRDLLSALIDANGIEEEAVASVIFTTTPDLDACFPAAAAREMGWTRVALMGMQEINAPNGIPKTIRILIHWNTDKSLDDIRHIYMNHAVHLRPDLQTSNKMLMNRSQQDEQHRG
jgi:chorismate mutase